MRRVALMAALICAAAACKKEVPRARPFKLHDPTAGARSDPTARGLALPERPIGRVSDFAGALAPDAWARLERQLTSYEAGTTQQIAVALFRSLAGESLEDFSIRLAERWKIGSRRNNDGVLVTVFLDDRKLRIEVGYGLEASLTDLKAARIIRDVIAPRFREGDLEGGLAAGLDAIEGVISDGKHGAPLPREPLSDSTITILAVTGVVLFFFGLLFGLLVLASRKGGGGAGGYSASSGDGWSSGSSSSSSSSYSSSSSSSGSDFSGGGGSFGGGGASGGW